MNISIREAAVEDFESIFSIIMELAVFQGTPELVTNSVEQMKKEKDFYCCWVACKDDGEIIGIASYSFMYYSWVGKSLYLDDLCVKQEYRGHKIGSMLLNKIFETARTTNCNRVRWNVSEWNKNAIDFYKKIGAHFETDLYNCDITKDQLPSINISL